MRHFINTVSLLSVVCLSTLLQAQTKTPLTGDSSEQLVAVLNVARDPFQVPDTDDVDELLEFTQKVLTFEPTSQEELEQYQKQVPLVLSEACERIQKLEKDKKSKAWRTAEAILIQLQIRDLGQEGNTVNKRELLARARRFVDGSPLGVMEFQVAQGLSSALEYSDDKALAAEAYYSLGEMLQKSETREVAKMAEMLIGAGRRMNLVGKPLELQGTTIGGKPFDIKDLRGKVVLIDFWATWCGPCRAEHPNIEKNYETYRDKGFEVVGVSLDDDREALEEYVKEQQVPWLTLHEKEAGGKHPAATYYGIFGIPAMMLVDQEGKVVSLNTRGKRLGEQLEKMLGEASK